MTFNLRDAIISEMIEAEMHRDTGRYQSLLEAMACQCYYLERACGALLFR